MGNETGGGGFTKKQRWILIITAIGWTFCSIWLALVIPVGDAPDERAHHSYVQQLADHWSLPDFRTHPVGTEMHQPPLYYAISAALQASTHCTVITLRLLSTACGLILVAVTFALARSWYPAGGFGFHYACAAAVGFLPMNLYICSTLNNDAMVNALVAAGLLWLWQLRNSDRHWLYGIGAGIIAGLAMLTKSTALAYVITGTVWFGVRWLKHRQRAHRLVEAVGFIGAFMVVWGWWGVRNTLIYGDPLAAGAFASVAAGVPPARFGGPGPIYWLLWVLRYAWATLWGAYDHLAHVTDFMPWQYYVVLITVVTLAVFGLIRQFKEREFREDALRYVWALAAGGAVLLTGFIRFNMTVFQAQARYFFCYLPVFMFTICLGLHAFGKKWRRILLGLFIALLMLGVVDGMVWRMWYTG